MTVQIFSRLMTGLALLAPGVPFAAETLPGLQLSAGVDYSSGDYGQTTSTEVFVVPVSARLTWGAWSLRASVPYVTVSGPADISVIVDDGGGDGGSPNSGSGSRSSGSGSSGSGGSGSGSGDGTPTPTVFSSSRSVSGIGDSSLALTYSFDAIAESPVYVDLTGRIKFATGRESVGLGSGTTDYFSTSELGWDAGTGGVYVNGGRRFLGSSTVPRVDGWQWGAGAWWAATPAVELGVNYSGRDASVAGGKKAGAAEASVKLKVARDWQMVAYGGAGLSKASADYTGGLTLIWHATGRRN